jgi:hypothetical protein
MIEAAVVKRKAKYAGEIGIFGADQIADEEIKKLGDDMVWVEITVPRNLRQIRYLWAIASKLADGGLYDSKEDCMDDLKIRARFARFGVEDGRTVVVPRSLSRQRGDVLSRLINRIIYVVCSDILPHVKEADLRAEIEELVGA